MNRYKLIAMDLDGTLNNDEKRITPRTLEVLMEAQRRGISLALASARPSPGLYKERDALQMRDFGGILMSYNGGRIVDAATGKVLFETAMDAECTRQVLRRLEQLPVTPILDDGVQFYVTDPTGYKVEYECANNRMTCTQVANLAEFLNFSPVKILMSVQPEALAEVRVEIAAFLPPELTVVPTAPFYLEIIPKSINKGQGLLQVCRVLGIEPGETIAFGDAENDIPIIPDVGMLASFDPVALDQACVDLCNKMPVLEGSRLDQHIKLFWQEDPNHEYFHLNHPDAEWEAGLAHAEEIGLGSRQYELVKI